MNWLDEALGDFAWWQKLRGGRWIHCWEEVERNNVRCSRWFWKREELPK